MLETEILTGQQWYSMTSNPNFPRGGVNDLNSSEPKLRWQGLQKVCVSIASNSPALTVATVFLLVLRIVVAVPQEHHWSA